MSHNESSENNKQFNIEGISVCIFVQYIRYVRAAS